MTGQIHLASQLSLMFFLWCLFSLTTALAFGTTASFGWFSHHCSLTPSYRPKLPQSSVSQYKMSSTSLSRLFNLWQLQRLVSSPQSSHASLDAHTSTLQTLWNSKVKNKQAQHSINYRHTVPVQNNETTETLFDVWKQEFDKVEL